eukprot:47384_1
MLFKRGHLVRNFCAVTQQQCRSFRTSPLRRFPAVIETTVKGKEENFPKVGDIVKVHYDAYIEELTRPEKRVMYDSSRRRDETFSFQIGMGHVIRGWDEGLMRMSVGQKATITCTPDFGYGNQIVGGVIPANSTLIFEVEVLDVTRAELNKADLKTAASEPWTEPIKRRPIYKHPRSKKARPSTSQPPWKLVQ